MEYEFKVVAQYRFHVSPNVRLDRYIQSSVEDGNLEIEITRIDNEENPRMPKGYLFRGSTGRNNLMEEELIPSMRRIESLGIRKNNKFKIKISGNIDKSQLEQEVKNLKGFFERDPSRE